MEYFTATYSPEDNKLRLSASSRLDKELYERVRAAGFIWAPKQGIFVAPRWTPDREDLLIELAGEIGDEDVSLVERAEDRAERFGGYEDNRTRDAERAHKAVKNIADGIPLGQPILVGHHSERHARRDAAKIENGMRKAVKMWETAQYWEYRAAGAIRHAKYKERPDVRARRIKTIEAEVRSMIADYTPHEDQKPIMQTPWSWSPRPDASDEERIAEREAASCLHVWVGPKGRGGRWVPQAALERIKAARVRAIAHCEMRLLYERAMLAEGGGLATDRHEMEVGGRVSSRGCWYTISRLNRKDGAILSVSVLGTGWPRVIAVEDIKGYEPPAEGAAEAVKTIKTLLPLVNYRAPGCVEMTTEEWKRRCKASESNYVASFNAEGGEAQRGMIGKGKAAYRQRSVTSREHNRIPVFLTDAKEVKPPAAPTPAPQVDPSLVTPQRVPRDTPAYQPPERTVFDDMKDSLKAGIKTVAVPQLFATPATLAAEAVEWAGVRPGDEVLEPQAGTGRIVDAIIAAGGKPFMVEIDGRLCEALSNKYTPPDQLCCLNVLQGDFLELNGNIRDFDRIVMNPPFADSQDIAHVRHAYSHLTAKGVMVSVMGTGAFFRQDKKATEFREWFESVGGEVRDLPAKTFESSGTNVPAKLVRIAK